MDLVVVEKDPTGFTYVLRGVFLGLLTRIHEVLYTFIHAEDIMDLEEAEKDPTRLGLHEEVAAYKLETNERFDALEKKLDDGMGRLDASMAAMKEKLKQLILGRVTQSKTMPEITKSATKVGPYIPPIPYFNDRLRRDYNDIGFPLPNNTLESSSTMVKNQKYRHTDGGSTFVHEMWSTGFGWEFVAEPQERETHQNSKHRMRKLKMSIFEGDDAYGWIYRVEHYFEVQGVIRREHLRVAALCLEGEALAWYICPTLQVLLVGENNEESIEEKMEVEDADHAHLDVIESTTGTFKARGVASVYTSSSSLAIICRCVLSSSTSLSILCFFAALCLELSLFLLITSSS
nr:ankyrin repeat-containing protein [Tanacetum cinerariifolium]